jgi:hypothetical protein
VLCYVLQAAKASLPVPFRVDGPPLAFDFDPIPTAGKGGAQGKRKRIVGGDYVAEADEEGMIDFKKKRPPSASGAPKR